MSGFIKLYGSILHSTVWQEPLPTKVVWITMLAMADQNGYVAASIPGLARLAGVSIGDCEIALAAFLSPDPYSRTKSNEGRRIREMRGGWEVINHGLYREIQTDKQIADARRLAAKRATCRNVAAEAEANTDPDPSDPTNANPERERELPRSLSGGIYDAQSYPAPPARSWIVPRDWKPSETQIQRVKELKMELEPLFRAFTTQEWNRPYSNWNLRFSRWIEDARIRRETDQAKR